MAFPSNSHPSSKGHMARVAASPWTPHSYFLHRQISSLFSRTASASTTHLWIKPIILMHRALLEIYLFNTDFEKY